MESTYLGTWDHDRFRRPFRIAQDSRGLVYVSDPSARGIHVLSEKGDYVRFFSRIGYPLGLAVDGQDRLIVGDGEHGKVVVLNAEGEQHYILGGGDQELSRPSDIAVDPVDGSIYVTDSGNASVVKFNSDWEMVLAFGSPGSGDGEFRDPSGITLSPEREIYVADSLTGHIHVYDTAGTYQRTVAEYGLGDGFMARAQGLAIMPGSGKLLAVDNLQGQVGVFGGDGTFAEWIGEHGDGPGELRLPMDLVVDRNNRLLVTSYSHRTVEVYGLGGYSEPSGPEPAIAMGNPHLVRSKGAPFELTVYIDVPTSGSPVAPDSIRIDELLPTSLEIEGGPFIHQGRHFEARARFWMAEVLDAFPELGPHEITFTGRLEDGTEFDGQFTLSIL